MACCLGLDRYLDCDHGFVLGKFVDDPQSPAGLGGSGRGEWVNSLMLVGTDLGCECSEAAIEFGWNRDGHESQHDEFERGAGA